MKKLLLGVFCIGFHIGLFAQVTDDFSDGNFNSSPVWSGDDVQFQVNASEQLQLNSSGTDTSYLSTPSTSINNTEWHLWLKQSFASSANNNGRVYLVSDQANLNGSLNGYFVQVGDANDSLALYRQTGTTTIKIIAGTIANTNGSTNTLGIKVTRDASGLWKMYSDTLGGTNYSLEGQVTDLTFTSTGFFGVLCKYTSSNATKFYYDNVYVGPIIYDTTPPLLVSTVAVSQVQLDLQFNENVELITSQNITNYSVNSGIGNPTTAVRDAGSFSLVHLTFSGIFSPGVVYTLNASGVKDTEGNTMAPDSKSFVYYTPVRYDVVINEIMADPDPQVGLPNYEYVEIANTKNFPLLISGWTITVGSTTKIIPDLVLPADSFAILCGTTAADSLNTQGLALGITSFPSLTNTGATITIRNESGSLMSSVTYSDSWYGDASKSEGGYSLEQIDPTTPCVGGLNWKASINATGGSPGRRNSVFMSNPDNTKPHLTGAFIKDLHRIKLNFSEPLDSAVMSSPSLYTIGNSIGTPDSVHAIAPDYVSVELFFTPTLIVETIYSVTVSLTLSDCEGNPFDAMNTTQCAIHAPNPFEVVINEIMADPSPVVGLPEVEYLELFNRSSFPIDLTSWKLKAGSTIKSLPEIAIQPQQYLALSTNAGAELLAISGGNCSGMSSFISITNEGTSIVLSDSLSKMISMCSFSLDTYKDNLKEEGGWSIEKIDYDNPCAGDDNWSASTDPSGGTPGKKNSVYASNPDKNIPYVVRASYINSLMFRIYFSEPMDSSTLLNPATYTFDNGIGQPAFCSLEFPDYSKVVLSLGTPLKKGTIYHVSVGITAKDCDGNPVSDITTVRVAIPDTSSENEIVINEILYAPLTGGYDYVELYNTSQKVFDLKELRLASADLTTDSIEDISAIAPDGYLFFPGEYVLLTENTKAVSGQYKSEVRAFFQMSSLPSYNVDFDVCALTNATGKIIDKVKYSDKWQFPLLNETKGISLERIHFNRPSSDSTNWHSAAESAGFGTPGYVNSQFSNGEGDGSEVSLEPEIFSPDNDGYNDVLNIHYSFSEPGTVASVFIYDAKGRLIRRLVQNELLGLEGSWSWDGTADIRSKASIGIYIVFVETLRIDGNKKNFKKTTVLGGKI